MEATTSRATMTVCPYCGRELQWMPTRWLGRGVFQCQQCGDFPDFRTGGASPSPAKSSRYRVLIVDDSDEHRELYATMLGDSMTVITAPGGPQGLALARTESPDVILLDVMMPVMDGFRVCELLKAGKTTSSIPIVMLTSLDAADVPERAQRAGAIGVLMKPCPIERLTLTIESAVHHV